jgi:diacylglycerol O-acyltransferase / wax synthase
MVHERLSPVDASFLSLEGPSTPMHISSLTIYEGPAPAIPELRRNLERRLHLIPRFRQRARSVPFGGHRPVWVDDPYFDLDAHVHHVSLPDPGSEEQLKELCSWELARPLDRSRPLWELLLIDGLNDGRFAVLAKTHHSLWDGVTGADIHMILLDPTPEPPQIEPEEWAPGPPPTTAELLADAVPDRTREAIRNTRGVLRAMTSPRRTLSRALEVGGGAVEFARQGLWAAPRSPLNAPVGTRRRFGFAHLPLDTVKEVKNRFGTTVNDVVLSCVAGALGRWCADGGHHPRSLRAMVPVSLRTGAETQFGGNRVGMLTVPLPVAEPDPVRCLHLTHAAMDEAKRSRQVNAQESLMSFAEVAPPAAIALLTRAQATRRIFNLLVTNVPGPQQELYLLGRRLQHLIPQAPLAANQGLSVAVMSYNGELGFGLLADPEILPRLDGLEQDVHHAMAELHRAARSTTRRTTQKDAYTLTQRQASAPSPARATS